MPVTQKTMHKLSWMGKGIYRCVNCGHTTDKLGMPGFIKENCPAFPGYAAIQTDVVAIVAKLQLIHIRLDDILAILNPEVKP